jgi:hypothetical protein
MSSGRKHEWRDNMPDGDIRLVTAKRQAGRWQFQSRLKSEDEWTPLDPFPLDDLLHLRELLWNKYQRNRLPYEQVQEIDALIEKADDQL